MAVPESERELVDGLRRGDEASYRTLLAAHGGRLLAVARRMVGEGDAPDALQDAFLSAFRQIESFRGDARLGTWLHRITVNACLMRLRGKRACAEESIEDLLPKFNESGHRIHVGSRWPELPEDEVALAQLRGIMRNCISRLPESYRSVLVLRDIEGLRGTEVAEMTGLSPSAVKVRLHRARQALRTLVETELNEATPWT